MSEGLVYSMASRFGLGGVLHMCIPFHGTDADAYEYTFSAKYMN